MKDTKINMTRLLHVNPYIHGNFGVELIGFTDILSKYFEYCFQSLDINHNDNTINIELRNVIDIPVEVFIYEFKRVKTFDFIYKRYNNLDGNEESNDIHFKNCTVQEYPIIKDSFQTIEDNFSIQPFKFIFNFETIDPLLVQKYILSII